MTARKIKARIGEICTLLGFEYNGKNGNVDPCYIPETKKNEFLLFFDGKEQVVNNLDDVMGTPFIAGHTLTELADEIKITEW